MIGPRPWRPWHGQPERNEPEPEPEPEPSPEPEPTPEPRYVDKAKYLEDGPLRCERDDEGRILPGTTIHPSRMWGPIGSGVGTVPPRSPALSKVERELRAAPFQGFEIDYALAQRLLERLDAPDPVAIDRLALLARRVVDDALRGRPHAQEALLERLQPKRPTPRAEEAETGMVITTIVVPPQGPEPPPRANLLRDADSYED